MSNTYTLTRGHLIYGICLPLALLLGYLLADPLESSSLGIVVMVVSVLLTPLLMKWYHPLLIFTCNSAFMFTFLPGSPPMWIVLAAVGLVFAMLNRAVDPGRRLLVGGQVAWSLLALLAVILITAVSTGGVNVRSFGNSTYGGSRYFYLFAGIALYFVLASRRIPPNRALLFVMCFFLADATTLLSNLAFLLGERFYGIFYFISPSAAASQAMQGNLGDSGLARISGCSNLAGAVAMAMAAKFGMRGILDLTRPWRLAALLLFLAAGLFGGFRSLFASIGVVFLVLFIMEKLHRTQLVMVVVGLMLLGSAGLAAFGKKMPLNAQRSLSFLPFDFDLAAKASAQASVDWRVEMWREVVTEVPQYLFKGRGYRIDPNDMFMADQNAVRGFGRASEWAIVSGDYHNGPLSILIPFGLWGALAFLWFLWASLRLLYQNCVRGGTQLQTVNRLLFACFLARVIFFLFLVGGLTSDLPYFVALVALGISLNGYEVKKEQPEAWEFGAQPESV